jgi:DNA-binding transcriptional LysR family regulator
MDVEMRLLRAFEAVAAELHFGRAAHRLYVSQPSISRAVRDLERALGVALFTRTSREVRLTAAGQALEDDLPRLFAEHERVLSRAQRIGRGEAGEVRLAFLASATNALLPEVVRAFRREFPEVALTLEEDLDGAALEGVLGRRYDVALVRTRRENAELAFEPLIRERLCVVVPHDHRLAGRARVRWDDLREEGLILWPRSDAPESFDDVVGACRRAGFSPDVVQEARGAITILALVAGGVGVSVLVRSYEALRPEGIRFIPLVGRQSVLHAAWRPDDGSTARQAFVGVARKVARRLESTVAG